MRPGAAFVAVFLFPAGAHALDPGMPARAEQTARIERDPDSYALPVGAEGPQMLSLTGRVLRQGFVLDDPDATTAGVMAGYRDRLVGEGLEPLLDCTGPDCGGLDFRFAVDLIPAPLMLMDSADFAQLSLRGEDVHVSILVSRVLERVHVQTVVVGSAAAAPPLPDTPAAATSSDPALSPGERMLLDRLRLEGHVPVDGLEFATGGSRLSERSAPALDRLARLLVRRADLSVVIVGHTDNQGPPDINRALSRQRAEAVRAALIARGVPPAQLEADGVGFLAPLTTNTTEAGRAANRRVELVLR